MPNVPPNSTSISAVDNTINAAIPGAPGLRGYQQAVVDATEQYFRETRSQSGVIAMPTGSGKSWVIAALGTATAIHGHRTLVLTHSRELVEQDADKLRIVSRDIDVGVCCAGLGTRDTDHAIIVASIQTARTQLPAVGSFRRVIIDECHRVSETCEDMYGNVLAELRQRDPELRLIGLSATPWRLSSGTVYGPLKPFESLICSVPIQWLVDRGYLAPLITVGAPGTPSFRRAAIKRGEFDTAESAALMSASAVVQSCVQQVIYQLQHGRRAAIVFCVDLAHTALVAKAFTEQGEPAAVVTGETPTAERDRVLRELRAGALRVVVNCEVLTTGFDAPVIDVIALMRPTMSSALFVQMVGRGMRTCEGKRDCLVLDYGGNIRRHGPVDGIDPQAKAKKVGAGRAPTKKCIHCGAEVPLSTTICPLCDGMLAQTNNKPKHDSEADTGTVLGAEQRDVLSVHYAVHQKPGRPATLMITYHCSGSIRVREWIPLESENPKAAYIISAWWEQVSGSPYEDWPDTAAEACELSCDLKTPSAIVVAKDDGSQWHRVVRRVFE